MTLLELLTSEAIIDKLSNIDVPSKIITSDLSLVSTDHLAQELLSRFDDDSYSIHFDMLKDKAYLEFSIKKDNISLDEYFKNQVLEKIKKEFTLDQIERLYEQSR